MSDKDRVENQKSSIDISTVKELIALMKDNDLAELEVSNGHSRVMLKRPQPAQPVAPAVTHIPLTAPLIAHALPYTTAPAGTAPLENTPQKNMAEIKSPIVGTFYPTPTPDAEPYVAIGSRVGPDTVVCIIEAMKVMNEIKAETTGTLIRIFCKAGQAVQYGQPLFEIKPD